MDLFNQTDQLFSPSVFLVNRFQSQEQEKAQKILDISGRRVLNLSKQSARTTLLGRMCLDYLVLKGEWYLNRCALTWKAKATKSRRLYFQLVPQVHRTEEIGFGLLATIATPNQRDWKGESGHPGQKDLNRDVKQIQGLLPTPSKSDTDGGVTQTASMKNGRFIRTSDTTGTEYGAKLRDAIGLLKTPGVHDADMESMASKGISGTSGNLAQEAMNGILMQRMIPTPMRADCGEKVTPNSNQPGLLAITGTTGHLSHHFTLDMMAFPPNWCDISEPVLQRLEKRLKTLKRISGKKQTGSGSKQ